jgi:hypothetical protein
VSSTQLEKPVDRTPAVITTPDEYTAAMKRWEGRFNVLTPFTSISGLAAQHGIIVSQVKVNPDDSKTGPGEVYGGLPFLKTGEVALAKIGLRKLAECGAISTRTIRTDPRTIAHYWEFKAIASYRGIDGAIVEREATQEWDLRDGSDRLKGWTANQVSEGRKNGLRNCEARAINAAIRECGCGIKQKYSKEELARPFIVLRVAFQPDMTDPEIRKIVTQNALGGTRALYPHSEPHAAGDYVDAEVSEPRAVGSGSTMPAQDTSAPASSTSTPKTDPNVPPVEGAVRIAHIAEKEGVGKNGRKFVRYLITDHLGVVLSTFDKQHFDDATRFKASNDWVEIVTEKNGDFVNIIEIIKAGTEPALPGLDEV